MGYETPNIDSIADQGAKFTDAYSEQSCTAGRSAFITGQHPIRTGLLKVGLPGAKEGLQKEDPTEDPRFGKMGKQVCTDTGPMAAIHPFAGRRAPGGRVFPSLMNLRGDPFETGIDAMAYKEWMFERVFVLVPAQAIVGKFIASLQAYPPRQKIGSFGLDKVMDQINNSKQN